ncbi:MAG: carboxypeptidase-like regulatory domain-containing protein [Chitinophagaceae bacterium]
MFLLRLSIITACLLALWSATVTAQVRVTGKVFDMTQSTPLSSVSVMSNSGMGTVTDSLGRYTIIVPETDSIWFSYLGKPTPKYPVKTIPNIHNFEISLHVNVTELKQVMVAPRDYHLDSIQNRQDYAKAFNFKKPGFGVSTTPTGGVGMDLDQFIQMFQFKKNRRMAALRDRLEQEEEESYIDHRFNRALIIRLTKLHGADLDTFVTRYRPDIVFIQKATEYELQYYIKKSYDHYMASKPEAVKPEKD